MVMMMVLGADLCQSVTIQLGPAIKLDGERRFMNERGHCFKANSDDGKIRDHSGRLPTARHGGQVCSTMVTEATTVVVFVVSFVPNSGTKISGTEFSGFSSTGVHAVDARKSPRSFQTILA